MESMQPHAAIVPPRRRPVKEMTSIIEAYRPGDQWTVQIRSPIFGTYCIYGSIHRSVVTGELRVGLALITAAGLKPSQRVVNIWRDSHDRVQLGGTPVAPEAVTHGAVVLAQVESFGDTLTIVGHAVGQQRDGALGVGHHIIRPAAGASPTLLSLYKIGCDSTSAPSAPVAWSDIDETPT